MRKLSIIIAVCLFAIPLAKGQNNKGIKFEEGLTWQQIKAKALAEMKYIFMDCYATWCGPCKAMDKDVYPSEKVGEYFNDRFIAVKVQMDSTKQDNVMIQQWYADAGTIKKQYNINAFPSFLFFSPDGKLVHRDMGYKDAEALTLLATAAVDTSKQYCVLLKNYQEGSKNYKVMPYLANAAGMFGDKELANVIISDYKSNYLEKLNETELLTRENLLFILEHPNIISSKDKFFNLFYHHGNKIDTIIGDKGISDGMVRYIIIKEEIEDKLWKDGQPITKKPDWEKINANIRNKYNASYAESLVPDVKFRFYQRIGDWKEFARLKNDKIKKNPPKPGEGMDSDAWRLNSDAWNVFLRCNDKEVLSSALQWSELAIKLDASNDPPNVQYYDTKANLLYKLGRVEDAIAWEEKAIELDQKHAKKLGLEKGGFVDGYNKTLTKMKAGEPTWPMVAKTLNNK